MRLALALPIALALLVALAASPAAAQAMKVGDLGPQSSRQDCMSRARAVLDTYLDAHGGLSVTGDPAEPETWTVHGWALRPGTSDAVILCPIIAGQANAFYTIHGQGPEATEQVETVAERIRELWQRLP